MQCLFNKRVDPCIFWCNPDFDVTTSILESSMVAISSLNQVWYLPVKSSNNINKTNFHLENAVDLAQIYWLKVTSATKR